MPGSGRWSAISQPDAARKHYQDAAGFHRALGDVLSLAHALRHAGDILRNKEKPDQAAPCYTEALAIYRDHAKTPPLDLANTLARVRSVEGRGGRGRRIDAAVA